MECFLGTIVKKMILTIHVLVRREIMRGEFCSPFFFYKKKHVMVVRDLKDLIFVLTRELVVPMHHRAGIILLAWKVC